MSYELWDTDTGNLVEAFEDEGAALAAARDLIAVNTDVYPTMLALLAVDDRGGLSTVASGEALGTLAAASPPAGSRSSR